MRKSILATLLIFAMLFASAGMAFADEPEDLSEADPEHMPEGITEEAQEELPEGSMDNFVRSLIYEDQFEDVSDDAWYAQHIIDAFEYGIVSGNTETTFSPDRGITVAEALVIASRIHNIYFGEEADFTATDSDDPWYQPYVDYAVANGIIWEGFPYSYTAQASRAIFAGIMANALPDEELSAIGNITEIPDVNDTTRFAASIYELYNAGILGGSDEYGTFHPYEIIKRSEVSVVALNIADRTRRKVSQLKAVPEITLYSDSGATKTVRQGNEGPWLKLGWSRTPVSVPAGSSAETILNAATLSPMKTNNAELDGIIDGIFAKIIRDDMTTYQKTKAIYDYLMDNCYYGWGAVPWSGKYVKHDDDYVVVMGKHILKTGHGTCDNYSAAFVAMARRIGLNAYFVRGYAGNQMGYLDTHEIAIVTIAGVDYVFDPQIDDYNSRPGNRTYSLFCKPFSTQTGRYRNYNLAAAKAGFGNFELK